MDIFESTTIDKSCQPIFTEDKISQSDIQRVLETTTWAPSPFNSQPWEFIIIQQEENIRQIAGLAARIIDYSDLDLTPDQLEDYLAKIPTLLIYLNDTTRQDPGENAYKLGLISMGTALANLILTSSTAGTGLQPLCFNSEEKEGMDNLSKHLNVPDELEISCMFGWGYLKDKLKKFDKQESGSIIVHNNLYGNYEPVEVISGEPIKYNPFFLIKKRKSYRKNFLRKDILPQDSNTLIKAARDSFDFNHQHVWELFFVRDKALINSFADLITVISYNLHLDQGYSKRMQTWMRYTKEERSRKADGILLSVLNRFQGYLLRQVTIWLEKISVLKPFRLLSVKTISKDMFGDLVRQSPLLILIALNKAKQEQSNSSYALNLISAGVAIQNILLAATGREMGAQFLSILVDTPPGRQKVKKMLKLPDNIEVIDFIRVGYIDPKASHKLLSVSSNVRRPIERIVHHELYR